MATSITARNLVRRTLAFPQNGGVLVDQTTGGSNGFGNNMNLDPGDVNLNPAAPNNNLSPGLNPLTFGSGMLFLHEMTHTRIGGNLTDGPPGILAWGRTNGGITQTPQTPQQFTGIGATETLMNRIRRQLGSDFGQRLSYLTYVVGPSNIQITPFSNSALRSLRNFRMPPAGSLWIR